MTMPASIARFKNAFIADLEQCNLNLYHGYISYHG